jgi:hypothetical protein
MTTGKRVMGTLSLQSSECLACQDRFIGLVEPPALGHAGHPFGTEGGL